MKIWILCLLLLLPKFALGQDSTVLKVHFLYGSKPYRQFRHTEYRSFGGIHGGHVGIELRDDQIINFIPHGKLHWYSRHYNKHSKFDQHNKISFYSIMGGRINDVKKAIFYIPISDSQSRIFENITTSYLDETPYDYAFLGMRCGAAGYDLLSRIGVLKPHANCTTSKKIFYPKKLRKRLFKMAKANHWKVELTNGSITRKWESD